MQRSEQPFIRDVFDQFSETRTGGAFTFMTGIGGFLQEFLYGTSGLRWNANAVQLAPNLTSQIGGVVLHQLSWHGRRFTLTITQHDTTVMLDSGAPLPVQTGTSVRNVTAGHPLTLSTGRPDLVVDKRRRPLRKRVRELIAARRASPRRGRRQPRDRLATGHPARVADHHLAQTGSHQQRDPALGPAMATGSSAQPSTTAGTCHNVASNQLHRCSLYR